MWSFFFEIQTPWSTVWRVEEMMRNETWRERSLADCEERNESRCSAAAVTCVSGFGFEIWEFDFGVSGCGFGVSGLGVIVWEL